MVEVAGLPKSESLKKLPHTRRSGPYLKEAQCAMVKRVYEWFIALPVPAVAVGLWLAGAVYISLCMEAFYLFGLL